MSLISPDSLSLFLTNESTGTAGGCIALSVEVWSTGRPVKACRVEAIVRALVRLLGPLVMWHSRCQGWYHLTFFVWGCSYLPQPCGHSCQVCAVLVPPWAFVILSCSSCLSWLLVRSCRLRSNSQEYSCWASMFFASSCSSHRRTEHVEGL